MSLFTLQASEQQQYGPVELETLRAWAREGRIDHDNMIYDHTRLKWIEASKVPQIMDIFQKSAAPQPVAAPRRNPLRETDIEDPLTRAEKHVDAQIQIRKSSRILPPADAVAAAKHQAALSNKMKLQRELMRTDDPTDKKTTKPPTVLDRITRIFLNPFARKKSTPTPVPPKKSSQRIKPPA